MSHSPSEKRQWTARVALRDSSSRHWARQAKAWPWTVGDSSVRRANTTFWMRNLCGRKQESSGSWHSCGILSGCSSKTITTSTANSRATICQNKQAVHKRWRSLTDLQQVTSLCVYILVFRFAPFRDKSDTRFMPLFYRGHTCDLFGRWDAHTNRHV